MEYADVPVAIAFFDGANLISVVANDRSVRCAMLEGMAEYSRISLAGYMQSATLHFAIGLRQALRHEEECPR